MTREEQIVEATNVLRDTKAYVQWLKSQDLLIVKEEGSLTESAAMGRTTRTQITTGGNVAKLDQLKLQVASCQKCSLGKSRTNIVFGHGNPDADLMFIGEAPGATEDETGLPFVGRAGKVLTEELQKNGISRDDVFICNILKCRPPGNRDPLPEEIQSCEPYLLQQIDTIRPKLLCGLGRYAVMTLLRRQVGIMKERGTWGEYHNIPLFICLHPSATLHQQSTRSLFNADISTLAANYKQLHGGGKQ